MNNGTNILKILETEYNKATVQKSALIKETEETLKILSINFKSFLRSKHVTARSFPRSLFHYQGIRYSFNFKIDDSESPIKVFMCAIDSENSNNTAKKFYEIRSLSNITDESFDNWVISNAMEYFFKEN